MIHQEWHLTPIGRVESPLKNTAAAPRQGDEGAPDSTLVIDEEFAAALEGINQGDTLIVLTWLHLARRDVLVVHPRGDATRPATGVFATRSPNRPNPIGLHQVQVTSVTGLCLGVRHLEAIDGTPILDIKPVLAPRISDR
ncbi:MAG: tRNA (N6-threonylcarbamoyladenosine(37)-N6)-methyltransferase TrmO [Acidimicrobiia bacterium]|nr:tRNA (N6-threonylcarbamoyladenosine(37)-N6)-methyltransferase TrmO [Acidimicrobiia bacterium]